MPLDRRHYWMSSFISCDQPPAVRMPLQSSENTNLKTICQHILLLPVAMHGLSGLNKTKVHAAFHENKSVHRSKREPYFRIMSNIHSCMCSLRLAPFRLREIRLAVS